MEFGAHTNQIVPVVCAAHTFWLNVVDLTYSTLKIVAGFSYQVVVDYLVVQSKNHKVVFLGIYSFSGRNESCARACKRVEDFLEFVVAMVELVVVSVLHVLDQHFHVVVELGQDVGEDVAINLSCAFFVVTSGC